MSYVTSYIVISNCNESGFDKICNKFKEMYNENQEYQYKIKKSKKSKLNETGDKSCQLGNVSFFAFNHFQDEKFENWFYKQKIEYVQVIRKKEHDEICQFL